MFLEKIKNYSLKSYLSNGVSGVIFLTEKENSEEKFVTKVIRMTDKDQSSMMKNEVDILRMVSHENIVRYVDFIETNETFYLIMEYIKGYTLRELLVKYTQKMKKNLPECFVRNIARQICSALEYLHSHSIVHRDLKLENIMFEFPKDEESFDNIENVKGKVKIIDFGFSRINNKEEMMSSVFGTPVTMSPQILESIYTGKLSKYDYKTDIWSLGIIIYELLFGFLPFKSDSLKILMDSLEIGNYFINIKQNVSKEFVEFIQGLIQYEPKNRNDWKIIMNQDFIRTNSETKTIDPSKLEKSSINKDSIVLNLHKSICLNEDREVFKKIKNDKKFSQFIKPHEHKDKENNNDTLINERNHKVQIKKNGNSDTNDLDKTEENIKFHPKKGKRILQITKPSCVRQEDKKTVNNHVFPQQNLFNINKNYPEKRDEKYNFQTSELSLKKIITTNDVNPIRKMDENIKSESRNTSDFKENINIGLTQEKLENKKNNLERFLINIQRNAYDNKNRIFNEELRPGFKNIVNEKQLIEIKHLDFEEILRTFFDPINNTFQNPPNCISLEPINPENIEEFS